MCKHVSVTVILIYMATLCGCVRKNVCKSLEDYKTIQRNPNCWYNPDVESSPKEIAERYGFPFESYEVTTKDGYIVSLFRVPHNGSDIDRKRPVVFLQHGILVDGSTWMLLGLRSSVFVFANKGYDVWISNVRGTPYSSKHVKYSQNDPDYWLYSFHELAVYDVNAMIEFIVQKTNQSGHITYIGHSMGATMGLVYTSLIPEAKNYLQRFIALAPVAYMDHITSAARALVPFRYLIWEIMAANGIYGLGENLKYELDLVHRLCTKYPFIILCAMVNHLSSGVNRAEVDPSILPLSHIHYPVGTSLKTIMHYAQIMATKRRFQFFDYGPELNRKLYNSSLPPEYPLSQIKVPVHLFYGINDLLSKEKDVFYLFEQLRTEKTIQEVRNFAHLDFTAGVHAVDLYKALLQQM